MRIRNGIGPLLVVALLALPSAQGRAQDAPGPLENLRDSNVEVRRNAAARLRLADRNLQREALPALIELLLKEKDGQVRLGVLDTVTALGPEAAPAVPALLQTLRTDYGGQRMEELHQDYRSALALAAIGKPAVEGLRTFLKGGKDSVRAEAVMALGRIGPDAESAVPELVPLLGDPSERIRQEASVALGRIGLGAVGPLVESVRRQEAAAPAPFRARAIESLGSMSAPDERVRRLIRDATRDPEPEVRASALKSLAILTLPDETLRPILEENLRHSDGRVRLAVVNWLAEHRQLLPMLAADLESLLTAKDEGVARYAAFLLGKLGPEAAPRLLAALRREDCRPDQVADALAAIGRPGVGVVIEALQSPEPRVRRGAALALGQIRPLAPGAAKLLATGLSDPDLETRSAFLTAIGNLRSRAGEATPAVRALLHDPSPAIRTKAIVILSQSAPHDDRFPGDLTALLDDADPGVERQAIDTLRSLGPSESKTLTAVIAKLKSPHTDVRLAAAELIGSQGAAAAEAVPALCALLDDPAPKIRAIAAQTLGRLGKAAQPAFDRLAAQLDAEPVELREAAALALGGLELDAEVLRAPLGKALRDAKLEVRRAAQRSIQRLGPQASLFLPDIILLASSKENARSVERMLRRFERSTPDPRSVPALVKELDHEQAAVRLLAIKFLGLAGSSAKDAIPALDRLKDDPDPEVRKQARAASELIQKRAAPGQSSSPARAPDNG
jgi:HEAT repeat protein